MKSAGMVIGHALVLGPTLFTMYHAYKTPGWGDVLVPASALVGAVAFAYGFSQLVCFLFTEFGSHSEPSREVVGARRYEP